MSTRKVGHGIPENLPLLHVPVGGVEPELDEDEKSVREYAEQHPHEDAEDLEDAEQPRSSEQGGAVVEAQDAIQAFQKEMEFEEQLARDKRAGEETKLPIPLRQRVAEVEATKRAQHPEGEGSQAKFVKFDPNTEIMASSPKQPRTELYSPTYAGNIGSSLAESSTSRNVRRVIDELELCDEDELDIEFLEGSWDWKLCEDVGGFDENKVSILEEEQRKRGFYNEGAGPPEVSPEELAWLDAEAMQLELDSLRDLDVIGRVDAGVDLDNCVNWTHV